MRHLLTSTTATALGMVLLAPFTSSAPAQAAELAGRTADLTVANRVAGAPAPGSTPGQQFGTVRVDIDLVDDDVYVEAQLAATPDGVRPYLQVEPGTWDGATCRAIPGAGAIGDGFTASGEAVEYSYTLPAGFREATCVVAFAFSDVQSRSAFDVVAGPLTDRVIAPELSFGDVELLGSKKLGLVRGVWTPVEVEVSNAGEGVADVVVVTGKGKGVRVKRSTITDLGLIGGEPYARSTVVMVKLTGKQKKARLTLTASSEGVTASRALTVRSVRVPAMPRPGKYAGGGATFTVTGGKVAKVKGFRIRTRTSCSSSTSDTINTYSFPSTSISRAGIVHARDSRSGDAGYTVGLEMLVAGKKATRGLFFYSGPAGCFARAAVEAKWVGR